MLFLLLHTTTVSVFLAHISDIVFRLELRKKARQFENQLDLKLVSFSKLGTTYSHRDDR